VALRPWGSHDGEPWSPRKGRGFAIRNTEVAQVIAALVRFLDLAREHEREATAES